MGRKGQGRRPHLLPPGDPTDPHGFLVLLADFLEALAIKGHSEGTRIARRHHLEAFIRWAAERALYRPSHITRPILERYQRFLFYLRKPDGRPLVTPLGGAVFCGQSCGG